MASHSGSELHHLYPTRIGFFIYSLHLFPQSLQTQNWLLCVCFPLPHAPQSKPIGPNNTAPQHPLDAEKSFPVVLTSLIIWQRSPPHLGHLILLFSFFAHPRMLHDMVLYHKTIHFAIVFLKNHQKKNGFVAV